MSIERYFSRSIKSSVSFLKIERQLVISSDSFPKSHYFRPYYIQQRHRGKNCSTSILAELRYAYRKVLCVYPEVAIL